MKHLAKEDLWWKAWLVFWVAFSFLKTMPWFLASSGARTFEEGLLVGLLWFVFTMLVGIAPIMFYEDFIK